MHNIRSVFSSERAAFVSLFGVSFSYPGKNQIEVLSQVEFDLRRGEFFVLLGPSGCGKTTVLNMLAGFERPSAGQIFVGGRLVEKPDPSRIVIFQGDDSLLGWLTTIENVEFGLRVQRVPRAQRRARAREALAIVGLADHDQKYPHELSGGKTARPDCARSSVGRTCF